MSLFGRGAPRQVYRVYDEQEYLGEVEPEALDEHSLGAQTQAAAEPKRTARSKPTLARMLARGMLAATAGVLLGVLIVAMLRVLTGVSAHNPTPGSPRPSGVPHGRRGLDRPARPREAVVGRRTAPARRATRTRRRRPGRGHARDLASGRGGPVRPASAGQGTAPPFGAPAPVSAAGSEFGFES